MPSMSYSQALHRWGQAEKLIKKHTYDYAASRKSAQLNNLLALLLSSTVHYVPPQGWKFLQSQGLRPQTHAGAFSMLVDCHEAESRDRVGLEQLALLRGVIADEPMSDISHKTEGNK